MRSELERHACYCGTRGLNLGGDIAVKFVEGHIVGLLVKDVTSLRFRYRHVK